MAADSPGERRQLLVRRIVESRRRDEATVFRAGDASVEYDDRVIRLDIEPGERDRLDALLSAYHVFKIKQPETRKAPEGVYYLSAVTDAKHAADFLEALFREVYGCGEGYELGAETG
jgi:hypothetical protein